jgi:hypothetical protein
MTYRQGPDGRRMGADENRLLDIMISVGDWLDVADLWREARVPVTASMPLLLRYADKGMVERGLHRDRDVFRLTSRGREFFHDQQQRPLARAPLGVDRVFARRRKP